MEGSFEKDIFKEVETELIERFKKLGFGPLDKINKFQLTQAYPQLTHHALKP